MNAQNPALAPLIEFLSESVADPLYFVWGAFAWGTGALSANDNDPEPGPDEWQVSVLIAIRDGHLTQTEALRIAVASGHGIGKSALIAWIILWFLLTKPHCAGIVTANTKKQLNTKTWREVGVWARRLIPGLREKVDMTATKIWHVESPDTWFIAAIEWSADNPDAFAGLHAEWVLVLFDEASGIADIIWETVQGAMTTAHALWIVFGNPIRNTGRFFECFGRERHRWTRQQIDSRTAKMTNKAELTRWVEDYGEDSDFVRVRIRGVFPRSGSAQLIPTDVVEAARKRWRKFGALTVEQDKCELRFGPKILSVDVARFGDDATSVWFRHGQYAHRLAKWRGLDTMQTASRVAEIIDANTFDGVMVDGTGIGGAVVDRLRQLGHRVLEINAAERSIDEVKFRNIRAEMWWKMLEWLKAGGAVTDEQEVEDDLCGPEYFYDNAARIQLESKDDMKGRGLHSPDDADALAMTFARPVHAQPKTDRYSGKSGKQASPWAA